MELSFDYEKAKIVFNVVYRNRKTLSVNIFMSVKTVK